MGATSVWTRVISDVDFEREGKQITRLFLPNSHNDSAWGVVPIPIVVVKNGSGPTLLLTAGTHGDEYEGQVVLLDLIRDLEPQQIQGRVIIIPALHLPACRAGTRLSPIDGRDINRCFPGNASGSFAEMLAHYVTSVLLPLADVNIDLHSGGRSLDCVPSTISHLLDDQIVLERTLALARAFAAPFHIMNREVDGSQTFQATAEAMGVISMSSELGGSNKLSLEGVAIARRGVMNAMAHLGLVEGDVAGTGRTRPMMIPSSGNYGFAPIGGIYCPVVALGSTVQTGAVLGRIYNVEDPLFEPVSVTALRAGLLWCQRGQGRIAVGDSAAIVVTDWNNA